MQTIRFQYGEPEVVALKFSSGKLVKGMYGEQVMYSTIDDRAFYLDPDHARALEESMQRQGIGVREDFQITKIKLTHGARGFRVDKIGGGDAGGYNVPERSARVTAAESCQTTATVTPIRQQQRPEPATTTPQAQSTPAATPASDATTRQMMSCFKVALDAVHAAQQYADSNGIRIQFDSTNVTSAALSCFIQACKAFEGGRR